MCQEDATSARGKHQVTKQIGAIKGVREPG